VKYTILKKLEEHFPHYVSGEAISEMLGVSRTAIWKHINELRKEGYIIESSSKKGYRLQVLPDVLNVHEIKKGLETRILGREIECFESISSTNTYAKEIAQKGCKDGTVVVANCQTQGRGRLGRQWNSEPGKGIWMSVVLKPEILPQDIQIITLAAAVAVVKAIKAATGIETGIKWPNDIILDGKKLCGILTEMICEMERINCLILGIGINVNHDMSDFPPDLSDKAISLKMYIDQKNNADKSIENMPVRRSEIIKNVLNELEILYREINNGNVTKIANEWKKYSVTIGSRVKVVIKEIEYTGTAIDITDDGKLVVRCDDGVTREILSGEISVRGILGYV